MFQLFTKKQEPSRDSRRCKRSGVLGLKQGKGARAKKQAQRGKRTAVVVFRCFSLSKNWDLNLPGKKSELHLGMKHKQTKEASTSQRRGFKCARAKKK
jgi:hypothetical protein